MKRLNFYEGVGIAFALAVLASVTTHMLMYLLPMHAVLPVVASVLSVFYVLYLQIRSGRKTGRLTLLALIMLLESVLVLTGATSVLVLISHLILIWLVRSLYFYQSVPASLLDLALQVLAVGTAAWAAQQSGSTLLVTWAFFLVQALFVLIVDRAHLLPGRRTPETLKPTEQHHSAVNLSFRCSANRADSALNKLFQN